MISSGFGECVAMQDKRVQALHDLIQDFRLFNTWQLSQQLMNELQSLRQLVDTELELSD